MQFGILFKSINYSWKSANDPVAVVKLDLNRFMRIFLTYSGSLSVVPGPAARTLPRNLLEMQILEAHLRPTESETLGLGTSNKTD